MNRWGGGFDGWRKSKGSNEEQKKEWGERQRVEGWNNRGDNGPRKGWVRGPRRFGAARECINTF